MESATEHAPPPPTHSTPTAPRSTLDSSYTYDAFDRVSWQTESHNGGTARRTDLAYLGPTDAVSSETHSGGTSASKSYSLDAGLERVGMTATSGSTTSSYSYARNVHGDVSLLIKGDGTATASYGYKPYGSEDTGVSRGDNQTDPLNAYRFNDRRLDSGSGSIDMGARRFGPDLGRFLSQDYYRGALEES